MLEFRTPGFKGFSTKYSPFLDSRIAVAAGQNFGLVGNGRLYILGLTANGIVCEKWYDTQDTLYDTAWSESHENRIIAACGDGSVKLFDVGVDRFPVQSWAEHGREVFSVDWNLVNKHNFLTSSWDGCIKIFDPERDASVATFPVHSCTYSAQFSPHTAQVFSAVSSDSHLRVFDLRAPASASNRLTLSIPIHSAPKSGPGSAPPGVIHPSEALTHDWNKYRTTVIATGGVDRLLRTFDLRAPKEGPIAVLPGHDYAIRKVSWSPHLPDVLLTASYDMSCRVWTDGSVPSQASSMQGPDPNPMVFGGGRELGSMKRHSEFATGVDWCLFGAEGWCASTGWDERVLVWDVRAVIEP